MTAIDVERPVGDYLVLEELTDEELERELTLAALSEDRRRRFDLLLRERQRRAAERAR
jgi:hypothetical protein